MSSTIMNFVDRIFGDEIVYEETDGRNHAYRKDLAPAASQWSSNQSGDEHAALIFICPCGCGSVHAIPVSKGEKTEKNWFWDGHAEQPTLSPSIQCLTPCRWHGHLVAGIFIQC